MKKPKPHKAAHQHANGKVTPAIPVVAVPGHGQHHHQKKPPRRGGPQVSGAIPVVPVHRKPKAAKKPKRSKKPRALAIGTGWACCSAEALAASLRLAGWPVGDADVLALHEAAGGSQDVGVPILAALEAASEFGLAGVRPRGRWLVQIAQEGEHDSIAESVSAVDALAGRQLGQVHGASVILGAELPGPHALTVDGPGVWSWGEWHPWEDFPGAVIEEAWWVAWPT